MIKAIKAWLKSWRLPKDPLFARRPQSPHRFGNWVLVELGATDYIMVMDTLQSIHNSDANIEDKGKQVLGLRLQVLAMSLRTKRGRIPIDWRNSDDLMWLANFPYSETVKPLQAIAELSDLPWVSPNFDERQPTTEQTSSPEKALHTTNP